MRIMKKGLAIILALAMIFSMVVVFAETTDYAIHYVIRKTETDNTAITSSKAGKTVYVDVYITADDYVALAVTLNEFIATVTKDDVSVNYDGVTANGLVNADGNKVSLNFTNGVKIETAPLATIKLTIPDSATETATLFKAKDYSYSISTADGAGTKSDATITILSSFTATSATASETTKTVGLGTTKEKAVEGITATVTDGSSSEAGYAVSNWSSSDYNPDVAGTYTFIGDVVMDGEGAANEGTLTGAVTVSVTVDKIALNEADVEVAELEAKTYQKVDAESSEKTAEEIATELNADEDYNTVEVSKKNTSYKENVKVIWAKAEGSAEKLDLTKVTADEGNSANVVKLVGTLSVTEANQNFKDGEKKITMEVTVVPAEIKGGVIEVNRPSSTGKAEVTVTVPAEEVAKLSKDAEIVAGIYAVENSAPTGDAKATAKYVVTEEDINNAKNAEDSKDLKVKILFDTKMNDASISIAADVEFAVQVTVDGTLLLNGDDETAVGFVLSKVVASGTGSVSGVPSSGNSGSSNGGSSSSSGSADSNTDDVDSDDKTDDVTTPDDDNTDDVTPGTNETVAGFGDVSADHWAASYIEVLAEAGIISGDENGNFNTEGKITRAEFTKMVAVLFGLDVNDDATVDFDDCNAGDWFVKYVAAAVEAGYINGVGEGSFAPNDTISREDACTILGRALGMAAENANIDFSDADAVADYAAQYIALLSELGFINGYEDGSFAPKNEITRAEAAKIIANIYAAINASADDADVTEEVAEEVAEEVTEEVTEETTEEVVEEVTEEVAE